MLEILVVFGILCSLAVIGLLHRLQRTVSRHKAESKIAFCKLNERLDKLMALADEIRAKIDAINTATNTLAAVVADIRSRLNNPNMTEAERDEVFALLDGVKASLEGIAADPDNPVPPEPPVFASMKKKK